MLIPPSPIPQNSTLCEFRGITPAHPGDGRGRGGRKQSKRVKMALAHDAEVGGAQCADIVMPSPDTEYVWVGPVGVVLQVDIVASHLYISGLNKSLNGRFKLNR